MPGLRSFFGFSTSISTRAWREASCSSGAMRTMRPRNSSPGKALPPMVAACPTFRRKYSLSVTLMTASIGCSSTIDRMGVLTVSSAPSSAKRSPTYLTAAAPLPRGPDLGIGEAHARALQRRFTVGHLRLGHAEPGLLRLEGGDHLVQLGVALDAALVQGARPLQVPFGHGQGAARLLAVGLGHAQVGLGLQRLLAILVVLQHGQQLAAAHRVADVDQQAVQAAGDLRRDDDAGPGGQRAGVAAQVAQGALFDGGDLNGDGDAADPGPAGAAPGLLVDLPADESSRQECPRLSGSYSCASVFLSYSLPCIAFATAFWDRPGEIRVTWTFLTKNKPKRLSSQLPAG